MQNENGQLWLPIFIFVPSADIYGVLRSILETGKETAMEEPVHPLHELFSQLGLENDHRSIEIFIAGHAPLDASTRLEHASFWTPQQAQFLSEAFREDADWAPIVDQLNVLLRQATD
jgi:hypothetical protein